MVTFGHHFKVFKPVIKLVAIGVMYYFVPSPLLNMPRTRGALLPYPFMGLGFVL